MLAGGRRHIDVVRDWQVPKSAHHEKPRDQLTSFKWTPP